MPQENELKSQKTVYEHFFTFDKRNKQKKDYARTISSQKTPPPAFAYSFLYYINI